jgi:hypothetical protein
VLKKASCLFQTTQRIKCHFSFALKIKYLQYSILPIEPAPRSAVGTSLYRDQAVEKPRFFTAC